MKQILLAMTAVSALCVGVPANAQVGDVISGIFGGGANYESRIRQLEQRVQYGIQRGTISRNEADNLRDRLRDLRNRESQYDDNGYSRSERDDLNRRIDDIARRIADAEQDGNGGGWNGGNDGNFDQRIQELRNRIEQGVQNGRLTRSEAQHLRDRVRELARLESQYDNNGLSQSERDDLRNRLEQLRSEIATALRNGDTRPRDRWDDDDDRRCPPGLKKKNNGCLPPGQAKKYGNDDYRDDKYDRKDRRRDDD